MESQAEAGPRRVDMRHSPTLPKSEKVFRFEKSEKWFAQKVLHNISKGDSHGLVLRRTHLLPRPSCGSVLPVRWPDVVEGKGWQAPTPHAARLSGSSRPNQDQANSPEAEKGLWSSLRSWLRRTVPRLVFRRGPMGSSLGSDRPGIAFVCTRVAPQCMRTRSNVRDQARRGLGSLWSSSTRLRSELNTHPSCQLGRCAGRNVRAGRR